MSSELFTSEVFASIDVDQTLERFAGGNETEVYRTDDHRRVVKLKSDRGADIEGALTYARHLREAAGSFAACLGPDFSIHSEYILARDEQRQVHVLVVQPFVSGSQPLHDLDYRTLTQEERADLAAQLREVVRRARRLYRRTGMMPDLYGRSSSSSAERRRMRRPHMIPSRLWSFLIKRNLLRSNNLLLSDSPIRRIVLVDYDPVERSPLYKRVYYTIRQILFIRDLLAIRAMRYGLYLPGGAAKRAEAKKTSRSSGSVA